MYQDQQLDMTKVGDIYTRLTLHRVALRCILFTFSLYVAIYFCPRRVVV